MEVTIAEDPQREIVSFEVELLVIFPPSTVPFVPARPGVSLMPLIKGTATPAQKAAYRERDMPLTTHYDKLGVISHFRHKLIFNRPAGTYKLFDLEKDPDELHNLVEEPRSAGIRKDLHKDYVQSFMES